MTDPGLDTGTCCETVFAEIAPGAAPPRLDPGEVHVWHFSLASPARALAGLRDSMDDVERARADRFYRAEHGNRFTAGRGILRQLLGCYTGTPPTAVAFAYGASGKPALPGADFHFNLSHSGDYATCAITTAGAVGVDVEVLRENPDLMKIAKRFFAPPEFAALAALPVSQQTAGFYRCWTAKEALIKAWGVGLHAPLDQFTVDVGPEKTALLDVAVSPYSEQEWSVAAAPAPVGRLASVAVALRKPKVRVGVIQSFPRLDGTRAAGER